MSLSPQLTVIRTQQGIDELSSYLKAFDFIAYDCETTGLNVTDQVIGVSFCAEEDKAFYIILSYWDKETKRLIDTGLYAKTKALLEELKGRNWLMHNAIFDCMMAEAFFKVRLIDDLHTDTMVLAHLLDENRKIGLKELGKHYFGISAAKEQEEMKASIIANGGTVTKDAYELYKADEELIGRYGAQDTILTFKLFYVLVEDLYEQGLEDFFYKDESMPLLKGPTYELNNTGLKMDTQALATLKKTLEAECLEAKAFILKEIHPYIKDKYPGTNKKTEFNIGSSSQLAWLMFGKLELEFNVLTDEGKNVCRYMGLKLPYIPSAKRDFIYQCQNFVGHEYVAPVTLANGKVMRGKKIKEPWSYIKCDKKTLEKYKDRYAWVARLLEYQRKTKLLNTYVLGFEERIQYGIMRPSFLQTGTTSGRYSSRNPNFQNLPRDDKRIKACVVARPGKVFVGADYSQLEPRVFAFFSGDTALMDVFSGTDDFYSVIGMRVYGKTDTIPQKDGSPDAFGVKYKKLRDLSKVIALASVYGSTANQLSSTTGKSINDTQKDIDAYFAAFPGVRNYMTKMHDEVREKGCVTNLFGRKRRIPEAKNIHKKAKHADLPYESRTLLNLAVNHPIQSTGGSIANRAAIRIHENKAKLGLNARFVCQVHDSMVYEVDEDQAETMALILQDGMETTVTLPGVNLEAKPAIGTNLAQV